MPIEAILEADSLDRPFRHGARRRARGCDAALLLAPLLVLAPASDVEAQESYQMLVNFGKGWKESGSFSSLDDCKKEAAAFAKKYSVQAGCGATSAIEKWRADERYQELAARCAEQSDVKLGRRPGTYFTIFGTEPNRTAFDLCMAESRQPVR
jgi:hypothetical protein